MLKNSMPRAIRDGWLLAQDRAKVTEYHAPRNSDCWTAQSIRGPSSMDSSTRVSSRGVVAVVTRIGIHRAAWPATQRSRSRRRRVTGRASQISMVPRWASPATVPAANSTAAAAPSVLQPLKKCWPTT